MRPFNQLERTYELCISFAPSDAKRGFDRILQQTHDEGCSNREITEYLIAALLDGLRYGNRPS
jgi:hypothetical protein